MKITVRRVFVLAMLTVSFGLAACHDGHPDRGDRGPHGDHYHGQ